MIVRSSTELTLLLLSSIYIIRNKIRTVRIHAAETPEIQTKS